MSFGAPLPSWISSYPITALPFKPYCSHSQLYARIGGSAQSWEEQKILKASRPERGLPSEPGLAHCLCYHHTQYPTLTLALPGMFSPQIWYNPLLYSERCFSDIYLFKCLISYIIHNQWCFYKKTYVPGMHLFHPEVLLYKINNVLHLQSFSALSDQNIFAPPRQTFKYHHFCLIRTIAQGVQG